MLAAPSRAWFAARMSGFWDWVGSILLLPRSYDTVHRSLSLQVALRKKTDSGTKDYVFYRPPYLVEGVSPGDYSMRITGSSNGKNDVLAKAGRVTVRSGRLTVVEFGWLR